MSKIILAENASDPATPSADQSIIFFREDGILYAKDDLGVVSQLTNELLNIVEDLTPQLGGDLDMNTFQLTPNVGIGIASASADGTLHIHTASAGAVTAGVGADDLVVENSVDGGISILGPDAFSQQIFFGSPSDNEAVKLIWDSVLGDFELALSGSGNIIITGLSYPNTDGTSGQVLTTDGAGILSFTTALITVEDEDGAVTNTPHAILNFIGAGVIATDAGAGQVDIIVLPQFFFSADQMLDPDNADWVVNAVAPTVVDSNNNGLTVRVFDDTISEGIGIEFVVPVGSTKAIFSFISRAETAPPAVRTVGITIYQRGIPDNAAVDAWSGGVVFSDIDIPTNENFQYDSQTVPLVTVVEGELTQFEITRTTPTGGVDLVGDWVLKQMRIQFI